MSLWVKGQGRQPKAINRSQIQHNSPFVTVQSRIKNVEPDYQTVADAIKAASSMRDDRTFSTYKSVYVHNTDSVSVSLNGPYLYLI